VSFRKDIQYFVITSGVVSVNHIATQLSMYGGFTVHACLLPHHKMILFRPLRMTSKSVSFKDSVLLLYCLLVGFGL